MKVKSRYHIIELLSSNTISKTFLVVDELGEVLPKRVLKQYKLTTAQIGQLDLGNIEPSAIALPEYFPKLLDIFAEQEKLYLVSEFIDGVNLNQFVATQGVLNESQVWRLLNDILPALKHLHELGLVHQNIKPSSLIKVNDTDELSRRHQSIYYQLISPDISQMLPKLGWQTLANPEYSPPEQLKGEAVFASDLYSLGVTCIYLMTGVKPFELFDLTTNYWSWQDYLPNPVSASLEKAIAKLIQNDLTSRFTSASAVLKAINTDPLAYLVAKPSNTHQGSVTWEKAASLNLANSVASDLNFLAFSPTKSNFAVAKEDKTIEIWNADSKSQILALKGHSGAVRSLDFSASGGEIASASDDKTIKIWNLESGQLIATLMGHTNRVSSVVYSPCGQFIASAGWDKNIKVWDSNTFAEICTISAHKLQINSLAFSQNGKLLASASCDRTINLWDMSVPQSPKLIFTFKGHLWAVMAVTFHPNQNIIASGSDDNTIKVWDGDAKELVTTIDAHSHSVYGLSFTPDGQFLVSASWDKTVKVFSSNPAGKLMASLSHDSAVKCITVDPNSPTIVSGTKEGTINIWNLNR